jgi:indole-3-glycerol phosphate synthase
MDNILDKILATKKNEIKNAKQLFSLSDLTEKIESNNDERDFVAALQDKHKIGSQAVIAEIKKASPSKGIIREAFDPISIALSYEKGGAACLSVLTDKEYFQGDINYIQQIKQTCQLPILRKDFIIDPYQIYESKAFGADCILLIAAALDLSEMKEFEAIAESLNMAVLVESHNLAELEKAIELNTLLIGINNRNLKTFDVSLQTSIDLKEKIPSGRIAITESGIFTREDIDFMNEHAISTFLIGEAFMRDVDPGQSLENLIKRK